MRIGLMAIVVVLCSLWQPAYAKRIQDLSMSPSEMIANGSNINKPGVPLGGRSMNPTSPNGFNGAMNNGIPPVVGQEATPSANYMDGYCDPNFKPMMSKNSQYAAMAACLEQQKTQACDMYRALPDDARVAIDGSINCVVRFNEAAAAAGDDDENEFGVAPKKSCAKMDVKRLNLLKSYWAGDQTTAYALVFLPDLVMDNSGNCLKR